MAPLQLEINHLEERMRQLCARLSNPEDQQETTRILYELRKAIRAHTEAVRRVKYASMKETSIDVTPNTNSKAAD